MTLFRNHLRHELRQLDIDAKALADAAMYLAFAQPVIDLAEARQRMQPVDAEKAAGALSRLEKQIASTRKEIESSLEEQSADGADSRHRVSRRRSSERNPRGALKNWFGFYNTYDPIFTWWNAEPYKTADQAIQSYAAFLRERVAGLKKDDTTTIVGYPIGRDALMSELENEMIAYTPEQLIDIAEKEWAWCEREMKRASRDLGYGDDWKKALEHVKTLHVEPGKQPELIRQLMQEAADYVEQHDLVTVPPLARETLRMDMMSPERQLVNPFFLGGSRIIVSYPTSTMSHEQKEMSLRGNNIHFARATVFHELIPGHDLQGFMVARYHPYRGAVRHAVLDRGLVAVLGVCAVGSRASRSRRRIASACCSGACTAGRASSSRSVSTSAR